MISASELISTTGPKNRDSDYFFVSKFAPFVGCINSNFVPFVCKIIPNNNFNQKTRKALGFTLIELVVTMAVAAILVAVAVPNMRTFIQNGRINTQTNDLIGDISLARSEAIKRRKSVGVCKSTNGTTCAGGGNWRDGRAVFVGTGFEGAWQAGDTILRFREQLASAADTLNASAAMPYPIIFSPNGTSNVAVGDFFTFCDDRGPTKGKLINLNAVGQTAVSTIVPGAC